MREWWGWLCCQLGRHAYTGATVAVPEPEFGVAYLQGERCTRCAHWRRR